MDSTKFGITLLTLMCLIPFGSGFALAWLIIRSPGLKARRDQNWRE